LGFLAALFIAGWSYRARADLAGWHLAVGFAPLIIDLLGVLLLGIMILLN
jgi:hypothetical protein